MNNMIPPSFANTMKRISQIQKNIRSFMNTFNTPEKQSRNNSPVKKTSFKEQIKKQLQTPQTENLNNQKNTGKQTRFDSIIKRAANKYGLSQDLIKAVIKVESDFNPKAVSHAGAKGLMQIMPVNYKALNIKDPFNPEQSIMSGTRFLRELYNRFNKNMDKALAAYNAGPSRVAKNGIPKSVKKNYVDKVYKYLKQYGGK